MSDNGRRRPPKNPRAANVIAQPSSSPSTDTDTAYCTEIARRAVARAALHLGLGHMETSALDILGSILLGYIQNVVGSTIANNVEGSGRSSAHANAYDVLNVVEGCTALAATQIRQAAAPSSPDYHHDKLISVPVSSDMSASSRSGWEGLASFLFGPNWYSIPLVGEDDHPQQHPIKKFIKKKQDGDDKLGTETTTAGTTTSMTATVAASSSIRKDDNRSNNNVGNLPEGTATMQTGHIITNGEEGGTNNTGGKTLPAATAAAASDDDRNPTQTTTTTTIPQQPPPPPRQQGKGKQLSNMNPPPGVAVIAGVGSGVTAGGNEKNVSFSLLEQKNSKGGGDMNSNGGIAGGQQQGGHDATNNNVDDNRNKHFNINGSIISDDPLFTSSSSSTGGGRRLWDAPYPNDVPSFPLVTTATTSRKNQKNIANPHCLSGSTNIVLSMHDLAMEPEACRDNSSSSNHAPSSLKKQRRGSGGGSGADWAVFKLKAELKIPKDVFTTKDIIWGSIQYHDSSSGNKDDDRKKSSVVLGGGGAGPLPKLTKVEMPSYVPNFLPPFPRTEESILSLPTVPTTAVMSDVMSRISQKRKSPSSSSYNETVGAFAEKSTVRNSLVAFGKKKAAVGGGPSYYYWGSNWLSGDDDDDNDEIARSCREKLKSNSTAGQLTVTSGPSDSAMSGRSSSDKKKAGGGGTTTTADAQVVPLTRASGSRVAKILEGSN